MTRFLVTLTSHADGPADELFVDVWERSTVAAIREARRACRGMGTFALMRAVPWPPAFASVGDAARSLASGER